MEVRGTGDVDEYAAALIGFLEAEPCARNVLRTVIELVRAGHGTTEAPAFWWVVDGADVLGAAHLTPPFPLLVSSLPAPAAAMLAGAPQAGPTSACWPLGSAPSPQRPRCSRMRATSAPRDDDRAR